VGENGTILKSTDAGDSWVLKESGTGEWLWSVSFANDRHGVAVGTGGTILRTRDGGKTWEAEESNTSGTLYSVSMTGEGSATVVGENGVILRDNADGTTSVNAVSTIPSGFNLNQNYPNPFNPSTTIGFTLAKPGYTTLTVANTLGQTVATLVAEYLDAGGYHYQWNAGGLASGTYFYQLRSGELVSTKRLILAK